VKNEIKMMFVHSISENTRKYSAMHVRSMLLKEIIIAVLKTHLNEVYFSKNKIFQLESESSKSKNTRKCSAMHVRNMLLRAMIIAVQKMHLNEIHFLKDRISQFKSKNLKSHNVETLTHQDHNVVEKQLNSVTKTVDCKQLISRTIVRVMTIHEMIYNSSSRFIVKLIKILQQEDKFAVRLRADKMTSI